MSFSEWREVKLEDIIEIEMGQSPKSEFYNQTGEGLPFLQGNRTFGDKYPYFDTYCTENKKIANKNDVIMSVRAPVGDLNIAQTQISLGRGVCAMRLKGEQNSNYLFYLMKHNIKEMINRESGTVFGSVNKKDILGLDVKITNNKLEQKAIAHILSTLDEKIEVNNQINKTLENMAQAIFKQWFVDFEFPNEDGEPYKSSGGEMVESELGMIPKGWEVSTLKDVINIIDNRGKTPPQEPNKTIYPIIDVKALSGDIRVIDYNNCMKYVSKETYENWFRSGHPSQGDILLSTVGSLAELKIFMGNTGCIAQNVVALRAINISNLYLFELLKNIKNDLVSYNIGSVQPSIKVTHIVKHKILIPNNIIAEKFHHFIHKITNKIFVKHNENVLLTSMRDSLIPKLMSGEIRVPLDEEGDVS